MKPERVASSRRTSTSLFALLLGLLWDVPPPDRSHPVVIVERVAR